MHLKQLKESITEMSEEQSLRLIRHTRLAREQAPLQKPKKKKAKPKKGKKKVGVTIKKKALEGLVNAEKTPEEKLEILTKALRRKLRGSRNGGSQF